MHPIKFIHCADIHIGKRSRYLGALSAVRQSEILLTLERICNLATSENVQLLLIAGDLFDSNNVEKELIERTFSILGAITPIKVVIAAGNHDPLNSVSVYRSERLPENVFILNTEASAFEFDDIRTCIYGYSFSEVYTKSEPKFSISPKADGYNNILLLHADTASPNSVYNGISPEFITSSGMDYIALGHIHKRSEPQKLGNTLFAYSGCPEGQGFDELDEKGVYLGEIAGNTISLDFVCVCSRMHLLKRISLNGCSNESEIISNVLESVRRIDGYSKHLYKIVLEGSLPEGLCVPVAEISSRLNSEVFFAKVRDNTKISLDYELIAQENSLRGIFVQRMLSRKLQASPDELDIIENALNIGLRAFFTEVKYRDDQ